MKRIYDRRKVDERHDKSRNRKHRQLGIHSRNAMVM